YHFGIYNNGLVVRAYNSAGTMIIETYSGFAQLTAGQWHCAVFTHDASNWRVYINGSPRHAGTYSDGPISYNANSWELGTMGGLYQFYGRIGGMFVFKDYWTTDNYYPNVNRTIQPVPTDMTLTTSGQW